MKLSKEQKRQIRHAVNKACAEAVRDVDVTAFLGNAKPDMEALIHEYAEDWRGSIAENLFPTVTNCKLAPPGWRCTRVANHEGPCAAEQDGSTL
jgi:hypothetical protein